MTVPGLVSIVMPFHGSRRFLAEAIDSVRAQTYPSWELLMIDDGSTDGAAEVARSYAAQDPGRLRYLQHPDGLGHGASSARNVGLAEAQGEYLAFLDADDVWLPQKLAEQVPMLDAQPEVGVLFGRSEYWYSWSGRPDDAMRDRLPRLWLPAGVVVPPPELLIAFLAAKATVPCPSSLLIRRAVIDTVGGFEIQFRRVYTDQVFYSKLLLAAAALPVDACWDRYRQHARSSSEEAKRTRKVRAARERYLRWLESYLHHQAAEHAKLHRVLHRELWRCRHPAADYLFDRWESFRRRASDLVGAR